MSTFSNPWRNPLGELLYMLVAKGLSLRPVYESPPPKDHEPVVRTPIFRFCRECKTGTEHTVYQWVDEGIETEECTVCQTTKLIP